MERIVCPLAIEGETAVRGHVCVTGLPRLAVHRAERWLRRVGLGEGLPVTRSINDIELHRNVEVVSCREGGIAFVVGDQRFVHERKAPNRIRFRRSILADGSAGNGGRIESAAEKNPDSLATNAIGHRLVEKRLQLIGVLSGPAVQRFLDW